MKKVIALLLSVVLILSLSVATVSADDIEISDELLNAVRIDYHDDEIEKEDIYISFMEELTDGAFVLKYSVSGYGYTCDMVDIEVGGYVINTNRPDPVIYKNGVIYGITDAYEQGVINDADLSYMSTLSVLNMVHSKISKELQYEMGGYESDEFITVRFSLEGSNKNINDIPDWIEDVGGAIAQLREHYENLHRQLLSEVLADFEYKEVTHNEGISIVEIKKGDIEKISGNSFVTQMDYISDIHKKYIECYSPNLKEYVYEEKSVGYDENGDLAWKLIKAHNTLGSTAGVSFRFGNIVVHSESIYSNFTYKFGVYDVKEDKFYDIYDLRDTPDKYEGLQDDLIFFARAYPVGDADGDRNITVFDATNIQRYVALLDYPLYHDHYVSHAMDSKDGYVSDVDYDGEVTVLDATVVQRQVANLE